MELNLPDDNKVVLPPELYSVQDKVEEYVQTRILKHFAPTFARKLGADLPHDQLVGAILETMQSMPPPDVVHTETVDYHLLFRHECLALGCRDMECTLCQFNPVRLCERNFGKKYLVSDALKAKCGASIKVEMVDALGQRVEKDLPSVQFEVYLVDGVVYKEKGGEGRELPDDDLRLCFRHINHKEEALLQHKSGGAHPSHQRKVLLKLDKGQVLLPDLVVTDSSEALLQGRRPPFRLLVMAVEEGSGKMYPGVHYAASEEFVVATRRVKQANKADIPLVDDHVSKIEHIGRETVKKLQNLRSAATEIGVEISMPEGLTSVLTVGQFRLLVEMADKDIQMRKILQIVLKLSKEKWEEAANHALQAVVPDFRKRVWYPPGHNMGIGLLFNCKYAAVQLKDPVSLVQVPGPQGAPVKIVPEDQLDPSSLNILRQLKSQAVAAWWSPRHPGWGVFRDPAETSQTTPKHPPAITTGAALPPPRMIEPRSTFKFSYTQGAGPSSLTSTPLPAAVPAPSAATQLDLPTDGTSDVAMDIATAPPPQVSDPMDAAATTAADGQQGLMYYETFVANQPATRTPLGGTQPASAPPDPDADKEAAASTSAAAASTAAAASKQEAGTPGPAPPSAGASWLHDEAFAHAVEQVQAQAQAQAHAQAQEQQESQGQQGQQLEQQQQQELVQQLQQQQELEQQLHAQQQQQQALEQAQQRVLEQVQQQELERQQQDLLQTQQQAPAAEEQQQPGQQ